jgi:hypothetical protein
MADIANESRILSDACIGTSRRGDSSPLTIALREALGPIGITVRRVRTGLDAHVINRPGVDIARCATVQLRDVMIVL